jgi:hypothetical protein
MTVLWVCVIWGSHTSDYEEIILDMTPCSLVEVHRCFEGMSVHFYQTSRRHIPKNNPF